MFILSRSILKLGCVTWGRPTNSKYFCSIPLFIIEPWFGTLRSKIIASKNAAEISFGQLIKLSSGSKKWAVTKISLNFFPSTIVCMRKYVVRLFVRQILCYSYTVTTLFEFFCRYEKTTTTVRRLIIWPGIICND